MDGLTMIVDGTSEPGKSNSSITYYCYDDAAAAALPTDNSVVAFGSIALVATPTLRAKMFFEKTDGTGEWVDIL